MFNPKTLREKVDAACNRGTEESKKTAIQRQVEALENDKVTQNQAAGMLGSIPNGMEDAALKKKKFCVVLHMNYRDKFYAVGAGLSNHLAPESLEGAAIIVWYNCVMAGLSPELHQWHDGVGMEGGFDMVIPVDASKRIEPR